MRVTTIALVAAAALGAAAWNAFADDMKPGDLPAAMAAAVRRLREHPAGAFAARLYASERRAAPAR